MSEGDPKIHCAVCGTDLVIGAVIYDEEDENKPVEWGVCPCPNCATTSPQEAARERVGCVKCGHSASLLQGRCTEYVPSMPDGEPEPCCCPCDAHAIIHQWNLSREHPYPSPTDYDKLANRIAAALSATTSDRAEPNIEQGRVPALGLYPDESAPSVAGGEPAPLLCGPCAAGQHYRCEAERILTKVCACIVNGKHVECVACERPTGDNDFTFTGDGYEIHKSCYRQLEEEEADARKQTVN